MRRKTDLEAVRRTAILFLYLTPEPVKKFPVFVTHPFFDNSVVMRKTKSGFESVNILAEPEKFEEVRIQLREELKQSDLDHIFFRMLTKYHLAFLKHVKMYMSKDDFEYHLAYAWVASENPNQDVNVSVTELIQWFSAADRRNLMGEDELGYYNALPDKVKIYRGVAVGRAERQGLSWTCNRETAEWFSHRFDTKTKHGYIIEGEVDKADIFAYLNSRGEDEILCNSKKVRIERRIYHDQG